MADEGRGEGTVRASLAISQDEARTGTIRTVTIGNRQVTVSVPAGIKNGQEIHMTQEVGAPRIVLTIMIASTDNFSTPSYYPATQNVDATELVEAPPPPPASSASYTPAIQPAYPAVPPPIPGVGGRPNHPPISSQNNVGSRPSYPGLTPPPNTYPPVGNAYNAQQPTYPYATPNYGTQPPGPALPQRSRGSLVTLILIILALVVIVGGFMVYYTAVIDPQQKFVQATATAGVYVTATSQIQATQTSLTNATATATLGHQGHYDTIIQQSPTLNDALTSPSLNNWDSGTECTYTQGSYHAKITDKETALYCIAKSTNYTDFAYQVQMSILKGDYGGVVFRANGETSRFYLFRVNADGKYNLYYYPDKKGSTASNLIDGSTPLFKQGYNQTNELMIIAQAGAIEIFINGKYLTSINDTSLISGQIGVIANSGDNATEVSYSQAKVWKL